MMQRAPYFVFGIAKRPRMRPLASMTPIDGEVFGEPEIVFGAYADAPQRQSASAVLVLVYGAVGVHPPERFAACLY